MLQGLAVVTTFFQNSLIGIRPDVLAASSLKSYFEFGYLTKKQLTQCEALIRCAMLSIHNVDGVRFFTFDTLAEALSLDFTDTRASRNALYYLRSSLLKKNFFCCENLSTVQQSALSELIDVDPIQEVFYFVLPSDRIERDLPKIRSGGNSNLPEHYIEIDGEVTNTGSLNLITHCLHRFMRISKDDVRTVIKGHSKVKPSANDAKLVDALTTQINVQSTSLTTSQIMLSDDAVVCGYLYTQIIDIIQTRLETSELKLEKLINVFSFPKNQILRHFKKTLGTGSRVTLDQSIERITSTEFTLTQGDEFGDWFMQKIGLVDENGNPLQQAKLRLLEAVCQSQVLRGHTGDVTYSSVVVALPQFIFRQLETSISNMRKAPVATLYNPVYWRPLTLLQAKHNGLVNALLDKYKYWCAYPGSKNTIGDIRELYYHLYEMDKKYDINVLTSRLLQAILDKPFAIAADQVGTSSHRKRTRAKTVYALLDPSLLLVISCDHDNFKTAKLSHLTYRITVVCLSKHAATQVELLLKQNQAQRALNPADAMPYLQQQYEQHDVFLRALISKPMSPVLPTQQALTF
jgi:hypothetical protein